MANLFPPSKGLSTTKMTQYTIALTSTPAPIDLQYLSQQLEAFNLAQVGYSDAQRLVLLIRDEQGQVMGGLSGWTYWGWLAIDLLWLHEATRGQGYGARLLEMAETEAKTRGCKQVLVDTMSFQAPTFYQQHGYEIYGVLEGFAGQHKRYYLRKTLA